MDTYWSLDEKLRDELKSIVERIRRFQDKESLQKNIIYNVASKLAIRRDNIPQFVTIGPVYGRRSDLANMEEIKTWYSMFFFYRSTNPLQTLLECAELIINLDTEVRGYYAAHHLSDSKINKYELMKCMLIDGCFLLELFLRHSGELKYLHLTEGGTSKHEDMDDITRNYLILGNLWMRRSVCQDLTLLDNQIPLFILKALLDVIKSFQPMKYNIQTYLLNFFTSDFGTFHIEHTIDILPRREESTTVGEEKSPAYALEILHKALTPRWTLKNGMTEFSLTSSATELYESGVNIKKKSHLRIKPHNFDTGLLQVSFDPCKGILRIPQFCIGGTTSSIVKNLVTFEQCSLGRSTTHHVTAYVIFMKSLIRSVSDIKLLKRIGIITKHPGNGPEVNVLDFFKNCCEGALIKDFYFSNICKEVEEYRKNWMHLHSYLTCAQGRGRKYHAILAMRYCRDPCNTIAFFAATFLLMLTFLQTFYTLYPYYHPR